MWTWRSAPRDVCNQPYARWMWRYSWSDMTTEAALTKLMHVLAITDNDEHIRELMTANLRGELTPHQVAHVQGHGPAGAAGLEGT